MSWTFYAYLDLIFNPRLRPGASAVAAALAVELAVSCLQHSLGPAAPSVAPGAADEDVMASAESVLGIVPHTIRFKLNWSHWR